MHDRAVGLLVGHQQQRARGRAAHHFLRGHLHGTHAGGTRLLHGRSRHTVQAHQTRDIRQTIEAALVGIGESQDRQVNGFGRKLPVRQGALTRAGHQRQWIYLCNRTLPLGERGGPIGTVGDIGVHGCNRRGSGG